MSELSVLADLLNFVNDALKWDNGHTEPTVSADRSTIYASDYVLMAYFAFLIETGNLTINKTTGR